MRIAHLSAQASPLLADDGGSGQSIQVASVTRELGCAGHVVDVFTRRDDLWTAPVVELGSNALVVHVRAGPPHAVANEALLPHADDFAARITGVCAAQERRYDVVHAHAFLSGVAAMRLKERFGIPFVMSFHGLESPELARGVGPSRDGARIFASERARIERELVVAADRLIAGSREECEELVARYRADPRRVEVIAGGFERSLLGPRGNGARARLGLRDPAFVALHVGQLEPDEGADTAIRAIGRLRLRHGIAAHLLIAAGTPDLVNSRIDLRITRETSRLQAIAAAEGVGTQVSFTVRPARNALCDLYRSADAVIDVPPTEPYGTTAIEAMASGVPVIGANVGAIRDAVVDRVTGYLVPPRDPDSIADRLAGLHANRERGRAYGRAGVMRVRAGFTWQHVAARLARLYVSVLEPHHARLAAAVSGC